MLIKPNKYPQFKDYMKINQCNKCQFYGYVCFPLEYGVYCQHFRNKEQFKCCLDCVFQTHTDSHNNDGYYTMRCIRRNLKILFKKEFIDYRTRWLGLQRNQFLRHVKAPYPDSGVFYIDDVKGYRYLRYCDSFLSIPMLQHIVYEKNIQDLKEFDEYFSMIIPDLAHHEGLIEWDIEFPTENDRSPNRIIY